MVYEKNENLRASICLTFLFMHHSDFLGINLYNDYNFCKYKVHLNLFYEEHVDARVFKWNLKTQT